METFARTALFIVNSHSRHGQASAQDARRTLEGLGFQLLEPHCESAEDIAAAIEREQANVGLVIVGGGDGTLNAAAQALAKVKLPLGVLPLGTANDFARTLGLPLAVEDACAVIAGGKLKQIDLGVANDRFFFNCASLGLSVELTRKLKPSHKKFLGVAAYLWAAIQVLYAARPFLLEIFQPGFPVRRLYAVQVNVGNGRHFGGGLTVSKDATIDDGMLDLFVIAKQSFWFAFVVFLALKFSKHTLLGSIVSFKGTEFRLRTRRPHDVNTDGEITTTSPTRFRVVPSAVAVFVP